MVTAAVTLIFLTFVINHGDTFAHSEKYLSNIDIISLAYPYLCKE